MFDFSIVTQWFDALLRDTLGLGDFWTILIECVIVGVLILGESRALIRHHINAITPLG